VLTSLAKTIRDYHLPFCNVKLLLNGEMIGNCFFFKKDDNTKMKKNASFFWFFLGKERGRIVPGYPRIGVLVNSLCWFNRPRLNRNNWHFFMVGESSKHGSSSKYTVQSARLNQPKTKRIKLIEMNRIDITPATP